MLKLEYSVDLRRELMMTVINGWIVQMGRKGFDVVDPFGESRLVARWNETKVFLQKQDYLFVIPSNPQPSVVPSGDVEQV